MKLKSIVTVASGTIFSALLFVLLTPQIISDFGLSRFGYISLFLLLLSSASLLDMGISRGATFFISKNENNSLSDIWGVALIGMLWSSIVTICFYFLFLFYIKSLQVSEGLLLELQESAGYVSLSIPLVILYSLFRGVLEGLGRFYITSLLKVLIGTLLFGGLYISTYFSSTLDYASIAFFVSRLIVLSIITTIVLYYIPIRRIADTKSIFMVLSFSWKASISSIASTTLNSLDRFIAGIYVNSTTFGIFSLVSELFNRLLFLPGAISVVTFPAVASYGGNSYKQIYNKACKYLIISLVPILLFLNIYGYELINWWLGETLNKDIIYKYIRILSVIILLLSITQIQYAFIQGWGDVAVTAKVHIGELILFMPAFIYSAKNYGVEGVLWCSLLRVIVELLLFCFIFYKKGINLNA